MREQTGPLVMWTLAVALLASLLSGLGAVVMTAMLSTEAGSESVGRVLSPLAATLPLWVGLVAALVLAAVRRGWARVVASTTLGLMAGMVVVGAILYGNRSADDNPLATAFFLLLFVCVPFGVATLLAGFGALVRSFRRARHASEQGRSEA